MAEEITIENPELTMLKLNKESGYNYRERRQSDWDENYQLYRDKVVINRLTQRQSVNLPIMKMGIQTLLKDVDDMPVLYFENLDNDKQAEVFKNEYWKYTSVENKMEINDIVDKKQQFLYGRSYDQWQIIDGKIKQTIQDPRDILVDRYSDPTDLNSSRFLIHTHIFVPLSYLEGNSDYDQEAVARLKVWYGTESGLIKQASNQKMLTEKNKKMADMGLSDVYSPILGETYVELTLHFVYRPDGKDEQLYLFVEVDDMEILMKKPLEEVIGKTKDNFWQNHFPYVSWAGDVERQDWYSDGVADIMRTPNKVLNSWFSQLVENRTLRNFGMNYYDSTLEGFNPQTFEARPFGWYPLPGKPADVFQKVDIPDLSESLDEMKFLIEMTERGTGATSTQQGVQTERQITLGEVQLALGEAKERIKGLSKFYTQAWKDRGLIFEKLIEAAPEKLDAVKIHKEGRNTQDIYTREISPKDWMTKSGYRCKVWSQDEKKVQDMDSLQKLQVAKAIMPMNPKLAEIQKRKILEFADLSPDDINAVMEIEQQQQEAMMGMGMGMGQPQVPGQSITPNIMPNQGVQV
jgi:hypothetical protein